MGGNWTGGGRVCPQGLILPILDESGWSPLFRGTLYFVALIYAFIGVSVITDIFMGAVVTITSQTKKVYLAKRRAKKIEMGDSFTNPNHEESDFMEVRVWNDTVANLTLMALGTSAPEILLACIEIVGHNFESGELGSGTIVGSAAFNLLLITAICLMSIPEGDARRIKLFKVFFVCSIFSVFAYIWLWIVLSLSSPHVVELWEAIVTFLMFPALVLSAYATDRGWCGRRTFMTKSKRRELEIERFRPPESEKMTFERQLFKDGKIDRECLTALVRELKKYPGLTDEDAAILAASKIIDSQHMSTAYYRIGAVRNLTGGRKLWPKLSVRLQEVYDTLNEHLAAPKLGPLPEISPKTHAIVEFHAATCAVRENIGSFYVNVCRHGNLEPGVSVRVESLDGSAKAGDDYVKINEVLTFRPGETEKQVLVQIIDDNIWEPDEEFFLKLSLVPSDSDRAQLGRLSIMEVTILDDDKPGVISFEKRGVLVKESAKVAVLKVRREFGADGEASVKWRTVDRSAKSGRDFVGGEGELVFKHREVVKTIEIPVIDDMKAEKDESFEVELFSPSKNASLGTLKRTFVTITNDADFANIVDKMMALTSSNVDSLAVYRKTWTAQMKDAMNVNGGDLISATASDYILHFISFNWKVIFSLIPPPSILGGWLCFWVSLMAVGVVTAMIGDLSSAFGCVVGLKDSTTAITLVAMGTSLPDMFASRAAALREKQADTAVGNITGSNSVNVFLGLGLPWLIASTYHAVKGTTFRISTETLSFSVILFSVSAVTAIGLLIVRRNSALAGRAELGGPRFCKFVSGGILILLWMLYLILCCLQQYDYIKFNV